MEYDRFPPGCATAKSAPVLPKKYRGAGRPPKAESILMIPNRGLRIVIVVKNEGEIQESSQNAAFVAI